MLAESDAGSQLSHGNNFQCNTDLCLRFLDPAYCARDHAASAGRETCCELEYFTADIESGVIRTVLLSTLQISSLIAHCKNGKISSKAANNVKTYADQKRSSCTSALTVQTWQTAHCNCSQQAVLQTHWLLSRTALGFHAFNEIQSKHDMVHDTLQTQH